LVLGTRIKNFLKKVRYKDSDKFYLISESYPTFEENFHKVLEMARELYWEAKRAP
jgi:hypothetical protein